MKKVEKFSREKIAELHAIAATAREYLTFEEREQINEWLPRLLDLATAHSAGEGSGIETTARNVRHSLYSAAVEFPNDMHERKVMLSAVKVIDRLLALSAKAREEERARAVRIANEHLARVPGHHPDQPMSDLVAQGYGNAALVWPGQGDDR